MLTVSNNSLEAINIANKINQHFQGANDEIKKVELFPVEDTHQGSSELDKSQLRLNMNLNVKIDNGKPQRLPFPQGDLILMFVPNRNEIKDSQVEGFMAATTGTTNVARAQNGLLFTSWEEKEGRGPTARSDSLPALVSNDLEFSAIKKSAMEDEPALDKEDLKHVDEMHEMITKDTQVRKKWNQGSIPTFPHYHGYDTSAINSRYEAKQEILEEKKSQLAALIQTLRKNYRQDSEDPKLDLTPHFNYNNVVAGELTRPVGHMSSSVDCGEINGKTVCKRKNSSCSSSFDVGCNDNHQSMGKKDASKNRIVPFSQPQGSMNMRSSTTTTTVPPVRRRTTTVSTTTSVATTSAPQRQLNEMLVEHVMGMDAHSLADAFHDPMMMAIGSMVVMAGAYMAIVMQEQAAANAFALAAAAGKK